METKQRAQWHRYSSEEIRFLKGKINGRSYSDVTRLFNERFGLMLSLSQIKNKIIRLGVRNGMDTRFGYGQINANREGNKNLDPKWWLPIGYERIYAYGYTQVKISHGAHCKNWKSKHSVIWEQAHGKIPEGHVIIFADGNKRNFDLDNLLLVSKAERAAMNSLGLIFPDKELTETGKAVAGLKLLINRRERDVKKSKSSRT